jgi:hypothetical protein
VEEEFRILANFSHIASEFRKRIQNKDLVNENPKEKYYQPSEV